MALPRLDEELLDEELLDIINARRTSQVLLGVLIGVSAAHLIQPHSDRTLTLFIIGMCIIALGIRSLGHEATDEVWEQRPEPDGKIRLMLRRRDGKKRPVLHQSHNGVNITLIVVIAL